MTLRGLALLSLTLAGFAAVPHAVFALAGKLERPSLSMPADRAVPREGRTTVLGVLDDRRFHYVSGYFVNWSTVLYYSGNTADLNRFLDELSKIDGTRLLIRFSQGSAEAEQPFGWVPKPAGQQLKDGETAGYTRRADPPFPAPVWQWRVDHVGLGELSRQLTITIQLGDGKIDLETLTIPLIRGAAPAAAP